MSVLHAAHTATRLQAEDPAWALLRARNAPIAIAVLDHHLGGDVRRIPAPVLFERIEDDLEELRAHDAVSAVLTPRGKLRFNAAAQDTSARGEDRSLVTYVRGAWRRSADEATGEVSSDYLRKDATFSGVLLRYSAGQGTKPVQLVKLYHVKRGSTTSAEVSELSIMLQQEASLPEFVEFLVRGIDVRRIKAAWPDAYVTDKHSAFAAKFSRTLGIRGDNALVLLHKTQSAKSLGTLDDLFRTFMLDRPKTFDLAETAVEQFGELSEAHRSVVETRQQVEALGQLRAPAAAFEESSARAIAAEKLSDALNTFTDAWKLELARKAHGRPMPPSNARNTK